MKKMNILYAIDEGKKDYTRFLGVSIMSLLENNKDENVYIYILSKYIEESNKKELMRIVEGYGKKIFFSEGEIVPSKFNNILHLNMGLPIATYYRFFFSECFDIDDRILYLDCDTIIVNNLSDFYYSDFEGNVFVGTSETPTTVYSRKKTYGLEKYINAGVFLLNIELFKKVDMYNEIVKVNEKYGIPDYNDQDYINLIFNDKIKLDNHLQCLVYFRWGNYKISNYLVLHTLRKPNDGRYSTCPKSIENLFNKYLAQTKRNEYVEYKGRFSIKKYLGLVYFYTYSFLEYLALNTIGAKYAYYTKNGFNILKNYFIK